MEYPMAFDKDVDSIFPPHVGVTHLLDEAKSQDAVNRCSKQAGSTPARTVAACNYRRPPSTEVVT